MFKNASARGTKTVRRRNSWRLVGGSGAVAWVGLLAGLLLSGCGFRLQGHTPLPESMKSPYLKSPDRQSEFAVSLRKALMNSGARISEDKLSASAIVTITKDEVKRLTLSTSAENQPNEYELDYTVRFSVTVGDKDLLTDQEVTATRTYTFAQSELLAKGHEDAILREDMAHDLAGIVMRRLANL